MIATPIKRRERANLNPTARPRELTSAFTHYILCLLTLGGVQTSRTRKLSRLANRGIMLKLVEHFLALELDKVNTMALQDIALCKVWFDATNGNSAEPIGAEGIPDRVHQWMQTANPDSLNTEGRRHQTLLRELIDQLQEARISSLRNDEVALLLAVSELVSKAKIKRLSSAWRSF